MNEITYILIGFAVIVLAIIAGARMFKPNGGFSLFDIVALPALPVAIVFYGLYMLYGYITKKIRDSKK